MNSLLRKLIVLYSKVSLKAWLRIIFSCCFHLFSFVLIYHLSSYFLKLHNLLALISLFGAVFLLLPLIPIYRHIHIHWLLTHIVLYTTHQFFFGLLLFDIPLGALFSFQIHIKHNTHFYNFLITGAIPCHLKLLEYSFSCLDLAAISVSLWAAVKSLPPFSMTSESPPVFT